MRRIVALLLLASFAQAQSVDQLVDQAVNATTGVKQRMALMEDLMKREGGDAALAQRALDPLRDPEVVHMAVEVLLDADRAGPFMATICKLMQSESHREKVAQRVSRYTWANATKGRALVQQLSDLARNAEGGDTDLRLAAIQLLGRIPLRAAVEEIATVWNEAKDPGLRAQCRVELGDLLGVRTGKAALAALGAPTRSYATYYDLLKEAMRRMKARADRADERLKSIRGKYFDRATPEEVFAIFAADDEEDFKPFAAARAKQLASAKEKRYGAKGVDYFTGQIVECLLKELKQGVSLTAEALIETLQTLYATQAIGKKKLPRAPEVRDALRARASGPMGQERFALAAIGLLGAMGADSTDAIADYADRHASTNVRTTAVKELGDLASGGGDAKLKARVGELLAGLLKSNPPRAVLSQVIFSLRSAPSPAAIGAIETILFPKDPKDALDAGDIVYCIELLAQSPSKDALAALERLVVAPTDVGLRITAVKEGLVRRARDGKDSAEVLRFLANLVRNAKQPEELRSGVLTALGAEGDHLASVLLGTLAADPKLEAKLRKMSSEQRLVLATRLLQRVEQLTDEHLAAIAVILVEERARPGSDTGALLTIARNAVQVADRRGLKASRCREMYATLLASQKGAKPAEVRAAWKNAADKAAADGLAPDDQIRILDTYRRPLLPTDLAVKVPRADGEEYVRTSLRLSVVAEHMGKPAEGQRYWLEAFGAAVRLRDRKLADSVKGAQPRGNLEGELATRLEHLLRQLAALPPHKKNG